MSKLILPNVKNEIFDREILRLFDEDTPNVWINKENAQPYCIANYQRKAMETDDKMMPFRKGSR